MSILSYGQRCVIVGGCPENIGLIVMVIQRLGAYQGREDAYWIRTVSRGHSTNSGWGTICKEAHQMKLLLTDTNSGH